jgi:hypothetical protein
MHQNRFTADEITDGNGSYLLPDVSWINWVVAVAVLTTQ